MAVTLSNCKNLNIIYQIIQRSEVVNKIKQLAVFLLFKRVTDVFIYL